jgi:hypothetical protein
MAIVKDVTWMDVVNAQLDGLSRQWLSDTYPGLAEAIEMAVDQGARPEQVRRLVMERTGRVELAMRCEQAARAIGS